MRVCGYIESRTDGSSHELARTGSRHVYDACICDFYRCFLGHIKIRGFAMARREDDGEGVAWCGKIHLSG